MPYPYPRFALRKNQCLAYLSDFFIRMLLAALLMICIPGHVFAADKVELGQDSPIGMVHKNAVENLVSIQQSIEQRQGAIREIREQMKRVEDASEKKELELKIERLKSEITGLQLSYEQIALGGINISVFSDQPEQKINWKDEIEQISRPILTTLKELTERPRQLDNLRSHIELLENQLKEIHKASSSIQSLETQVLSTGAANMLKQLQVDWLQRRDDTRRELEIARYKLESLKTEEQAWQKNTWETIVEFLFGRGLTLFLAIVISVIIWLISKLVLSIYWRWLYKTQHNIGVTHAPLVIYSYRLFTVTLIVVAILMVFYVRGDVLLLTLAVLALAGAALSLRQTLPRYTAELRLLLGIGPVREKERLVLDGIPLIVESLSIYTVLRNPLLEGVLRLPLHSMNTLASRPAGQESWFPCQPGEYILTPSGNLGRVLRQTLEFVEIAVMDSVVQIPTKDFLSQNVRNLTRDGFGVAGTFGIDYQHQAICLDIVPRRLQEGIVDRFGEAGLKDDIESMLVEFKSAGASSLDYHIYMIINGRAAKAFFKIQRIVQQACVEICNREGWVIPFTQITVHSSNEVDQVGQEIIPPT